MHKTRRERALKCASVVRQPGHYELVGWRLAQRRSRQLHDVTWRWSCSPGLAHGQLSRI